MLPAHHVEQDGVVALKLVLNESGRDAHFQVQFSAEGAGTTGFNKIGP